MNIPKISVVIPVYNTQAYVGEAIESAREQSLRDIEIIVIDDGSTDRSPSIIRELANTDPRIRIYTQTNQGVSAARNKGLEYVKGEFIYFLDSDDLLEKNALEQCYRQCIEHNLDFVFFDAQTINTGNYHAQNYIHKAENEKRVKKGIEWFDYQLDTHTFRTPVWLNLIRTAFLRQYRLSFYPGIIHEDELFCFQLYLYADRVGYIPQIFSRRRLREGSIMTRNFSGENIAGYLTVMKEIKRLQQAQPIPVRKIIDKYFRTTLNAIVWKAHLLPFTQKQKLFTTCIRENYFHYVRLRNFLVMFLKQNNPDK